MRTKIIVFVFSLFLSLFLSSNKSFAQASDSELGNVMQKNLITRDYRVVGLYNFLNKNNSPLTPYAGEMVEKADQYAIPWNLLAAISGTESTFGLYEPYNCYNSWGFGIYGNQTKCFSSYSEAIDAISKSIRNDYINKWGSRYVSDLGKIYASSPTWSEHTEYFMHNIEMFSEQYKIYSLPISM